MTLNSIRLVQSIIGNLLAEGKRIVKIRTLTFALEIIKGVRSAYAYILISTVATLSLVTSFYISVFLWAAQIEAIGEFRFTIPFLVALTLFFFSALLLYYSIRERTWVNAMGLEERVNNVARPSTKEGAQHENKSPPYNAQAAIAQLIEEIIEEKLRKKSSSEGVHIYDKPKEEPPSTKSAGSDPSNLH